MRSPFRRWARPLRDASLLGAVDHLVDQLQVGIKQSNRSLLMRKHEVDVARRVGLAVGGERAIAAARDEAERGDLAAVGVADRLVRQIQPAERHGQRVGVVKFDEVVVVWREAVGQPLVDLEHGRIANRLGDVGRSEGWRVQGPGAAAGGAADAQAGQLESKGDAIELPPAVGERVEEVNAFAVVVEGEAGMNAAGAVGVVGVEDEVAVGRDRRTSREDKLARVGRIVGDAHAAEIAVDVALVVHLDLVGERAVLGQHLVDEQLRSAVLTVQVLETVAARPTGPGRTRQNSSRSR